MPVPVIQTLSVPSLHPPRPSKPLRPVPRYAVVDDAWTVFGVFLIAALVIGAGYCVWRAFRTPEETLPPVVVEATALPTPAYAPVQGQVTTDQAAGAPMPARVPTLPMADQPVGWGDLTLMLRAGLTDADIIDALRGKQLVVAIGPTQAAALRELGAGDRLLSYLRTRLVYAAPTAGSNVVTPRPAAPTSVVVRTAPALAPPLPTPVDYAARDRQIKNLALRIADLDAQILQLRTHPGERWRWGVYDGPNNRYDDGSALKKVLDDLDKQRNDLRREKWQLEGR